MGNIFVCPKCGNSDPRYIGFINGKPYCRLCLSFKGEDAKKDYRIKKNIKLTLDYPLSAKQKKISDEVVTCLKEKKNVLIHAVTGAGKTELVYKAMEMYLSLGLHVGFATPRKDVVIDLKPRIQEAFKDARVIAVYGEHTKRLNGDIIVLTTHQLYRYNHYFDLLILDEIDAFPYAGNRLLQTFFYNSVRGNYILLSATPSTEILDKMKREGRVLELFERYHKGKLIVPKVIEKPEYFLIATCLKELKRFITLKKPVFIFVPTIETGKNLFKLLSLFIKDGSFVSSQEEMRKIDIEKFKNGDLKYLVTTSILERGVTVKDLQVIVFEADNYIYNKETLIQIAGRVGRKIGATNGEVLFIASDISNAMQEAIEDTKRYNEHR